MTEHIDAARLDQDVRYRFEYLSKFLNFTQDGVCALNNLASIIIPLIPVIVDAVYRKLFSFDITKNYFLLRNDGFANHLPKESDNFTLNCEQMIFRQDMLSVYLRRVLMQKEWTDGFLQYIARVGLKHTDKAGASSINVDFIHINALLAYIENLLIDTIYSSETIDDKMKKAAIMALNKCFRIQCDFFLMHYTMTSKDNVSTCSTTDQPTKCVCS
jgi:hypothetical protein